MRDDAVPQDDLPRVETPTRSETPTREDWLVISTLVMGAAYLVANVVPFFEELTVLIGAIIGGPISLGIPALFAICAHDQVSERALRETESTKLGIK